MKRNQQHVPRVGGDRDLKAPPSATRIPHAASPFVTELVQIICRCKPAKPGFEKRLEAELSRRFDADFLEGGKFAAVEATALLLRQQFIEVTLADLLAVLQSQPMDLRSSGPGRQRATIRTNGYEASKATA